MRNTLPYTGLLALLLAVLATGCATDNIPADIVDILRRVPGEETLVVAVEPAAIAQSTLVQALYEETNINDKKDLEEGWQKGREIVGIDPAEDIERIVVMLEDLQHPKQSWSVLLQGDIDGFFLDSLVAFGMEADTLESIQDFAVYQVKTGKEHTGSVFLAWDASELMVTGTQERLVAMIDRKFSDTLPVHLTQLRQYFENLPYAKDAWCLLPVKAVMDDVWSKAQKLDPNFDLQAMQIAHIQGGLSLNGKIGVCMQAYAPAAEQLTLLTDALNGLLAMGKLTIGTIPKARRLLDHVQIQQEAERLDVLIDLPLAELRDLQAMVDGNMKP
jgi:hypothetical protein